MCGAIRWRVAPPLHNSILEKRQREAAWGLPEQALQALYGNTWESNPTNHGPVTRKTTKQKSAKDKSENVSPSVQNNCIFDKSIISSEVS